MTLTEEQKQSVAKWAAAGDGVAEIQTKLSDEFNIRISFMDVRLLLLDIDVSVKDKETPKSGKPAPQPGDDLAAGDSAPEDDVENDVEYENIPEDGSEKTLQAANVRVELSKVARPGMAVNGDVTFSDGMTAQWGITQYGEISLAPAKDGYRPSHEDIAAFQTELRKILRP